MIMGKNLSIDCFKRYLSVFKNIKSLSSWIIYFNDLLSLDIFKELLDGSYQEAFKGDLDFSLKPLIFLPLQILLFLLNIKKLRKN